MLTIPPVLTHKSGVVVYPDDEDINLYYCFQSVPRLRIGDDGAPVFNALFWTDQADGAGDSVAGLRGALLNFDVDLGIPDDVIEEIGQDIKSSRIQAMRQNVNRREEKERVERLARARGEAFNASLIREQEIGDVRFGTIRFTEGKATLLVEDSGSFIEWSSNGGPPSMLATNNAAFALRLGAEGAAVWHGALLQNAAAVGVIMELKHDVRLPSLEIHVWAGSTQSVEVERKVTRVVENQDTGCGDEDVEVVNVTAISEKLHEEGLVNIEITKGSSQISDEHVSQLRTMAINLISERVKEMLASRLRGLTEEERKSSLIQYALEEINAFAELRFTQRDVVQWPANPQATITDFFRGLSEGDRRQLMTVVDLSNPVVSTLEVSVKVVADWNGSPEIAQVVVRVEYQPAGNQAVQEISLNKIKPEDKLFWRRVGRGSEDGSEDVRFSAKAFLRGSAEPVRLRGGTSNGEIIILVPILGKFEVAFKPHPNTFSAKGSGEITGVQIDYRYKAEDAPDHVSGSTLISPKNIDDGVTVEATTFREIDDHLLFKTSFIRANDPAIVIDKEQAVWMRFGKGQANLPTPWPDTLRLHAQVSPDLEGLNEITVEFRHEDPETGFESDATLFLDKDGWDASTKVVQARKEAQRFRYRYSVMGQSQLSRGPWVDAEGDQNIVLPVLAVQVRTFLLGLGETFQVAILRFKYKDEAHEYETSHEVFLRKDDPEPVWLIPRVDSTNDKYTYNMTLIRMEDGSEVVVPETQGEGANLIVRPPE